MKKDVEVVQERYQENKLKNRKEEEMIFKYSEKNKRIINEGFNVVNVYQEPFSKMDYVVVNLDGEHGVCKNTKSIKYWIIIEGKATVYLEDEKNEVKQGDFIVIDKNVKHNIIGKVKFGVICIPAFDADTESDMF